MPSISIVIPAFNESARLPDTLNRVISYLSAHPNWNPWELIVVDDGSTDDTAAQVERVHRSNPRVSLLRNPGNRGKGYSVQHGMLEARHEWLLFSDADLSTPIEELDRLYARCASGDCAVAIGSRAIDRSLIEQRQSVLREWGGRGMNLLMRLIIGLDIADTQCGFKLFRRDAAMAVFPLQRTEGFGFDPEILFLAERAGFRIAEVAVRWHHVEGTKVRLVRDSLRMVMDFLRVRWRQFTGQYRRSQGRARAAMLF